MGVSSYFAAKQVKEVTLSSEQKESLEATIANTKARIAELKTALEAEFPQL